MSIHLTKATISGLSSVRYDFAAYPPVALFERKAIQAVEQFINNIKNKTKWPIIFGLFFLFPFLNLTSSMFAKFRYSIQRFRKRNILLDHNLIHNLVLHERKLMKPNFVAPSKNIPPTKKKKHSCPHLCLTDGERKH